MDEQSTVEFGQPAPDFCLPNQSGESWRLSDRRGKVIAMLFYPRDETLVCTRQLCSVRNRWEEYTSTGAEIVAISPDSIDSHQSFAVKNGLPFPLLSDYQGAVARKYIAHWLYPLSFTRGLVVVDAEGIIRCRKTMSRVFRPMDSEVISMIRRAQLARHGVMTPNWGRK